MRPRTLLILALVVAAGGAFIWFYERKLPSTEKRTELAKRVLSVEADTVEEVRIESGGKTIRLLRDPAPAEPKAEDGTSAITQPREWRLVEPMAATPARADRAAVDRLVSSLAGLEKLRTLEEVDRAGAGLDSPRFRVRLKTGAGETVLEVGEAVPASHNLIVAIGGKSGAYVVSDAVLSDLTREPGDWRSRELFPGLRDQIERLSLQPAGGEKILLARRGEEFWIESPLVDRADRDQSNRLLTDLVGLRIERFLDLPPPLAEVGLAPASGVLEAVLREKAEPFRVEVGTVTPDGARLFARVGGQVFETTTRLDQAMAKPLAEWRSLALSAFEVYRVDAARVKSKGETIELARAGTDWKRGTETISYSPVSDLLYALTGTKAERLLDSTAVPALASGGPAPDLEIVLTATDKSEETLSLFPETADGVLARASGRDSVLLLSPATAAEIRDKLTAVRQAEPLPAPESEELPEALQIETEEGGAD